MNVNQNPRYALDVDALAYAMKKAGMSGYGRIVKLADAAGLDYCAARRMVAGQTANPSASTLIQLARALGCAAEDLMREIG